MSGLIPKPIDLINRPFRGDNIKILITTWNMGNAEPAGMQSIFGDMSEIENFDIYAIGLQESTYTTKGKEADCISLLATQLKEIFGAHYKMVAHCHRAQLQLYVFAKGSLEHRISNLEMSIENTGFLHVFPNKGGLLVTFNIDGTKLAFVSCHLAAHEGLHHCEQRNASIVEILGGVRAGDNNIDITEQFHHVFWMGDMNYRVTFDPAQPANIKKNIELLQRATKTSDVKITIGADATAENESLDEKHVLAGLGDEDSDAGEEEGLDGSDHGENTSGTTPKKLAKIQDRKKVLDMIVREQWHELLELDELNREISAKRVLNGFIALQPHWPPTFKRTRMQSIPVKETSTSNGEVHWQLRRGAPPSGGNTPAKGGESAMDSIITLQTEGRSVGDYYNHKRIPSYTDRILHKSAAAFASNLSNMFFLSCEKAVSSDHKPVKAGFDLAVTRGSADIYIHREVIVKKAARGTGQKLRLVVDNLKGYNLEEMDAAVFGGGSDPYIVIKADPPTLLMKKERIDPSFEGVKSSVIYHNLNPVWSETMNLVLASLDFEGMARNASLMFEVWDEDKISADDLIGVFTIPMKSILRCVIENRPYQFDEILRMNSEIMGRLSGTIRLEGNFSDIENQVRGLGMERGRAAHYITLKQAGIEQQELRPSGCSCTIN